MRFPWLQVDADFLATGAGDLAELLRTSGGIPAELQPVSESEAGWAMVRLWGWAISKAETPEALGLLADEDMQRLAERAAGWRGAPGAFLAALLKPAVGLAQREEGGAVRLAGMERYASTLRRMEADRARKSGKAPKELPRNSTGTPSELQRKTQTQTQTQKETSASQASAAASPPGDDLPDSSAFALEAQEPPGPPAKKPRETPPGEVLYVRLESSRRAECGRADVPFVPSRWAYSRQNKDLGPIAKLPDGHEDKARFEAAWGAFCDDPDAAGLDEPFSLSFFWKMRSRYEGRGLKAVGS